MVCKHCGNQLSIEDERCPFCGQINEAVKQHTKEMKAFTQEFEQTKEVVLGETKRVKRYLPLLILIGVLAVGNLVALFLIENGYRFQYNAEKRKINSRESSYYNELLQMEAEGNYCELALYYEENNLYSNERLREFHLVSDAGHHYGIFLFRIENLIAGQIIKRYDESVSYDWKYLGDSVYELCRIIRNDRNYYESDDARKGTHGEAIEEIRKQMEGILTEVVGLNEEQLEELYTADSQKISTMIREALEQ